MIYFIFSRPGVIAIGESRPCSCFLVPSFDPSLDRTLWTIFYESDMFCGEMDGLGINSESPPTTRT